MAWPTELVFLFSRNRHGFGRHGLGLATPAADGPVAVAVYGASVQVPSLCLWDPHPKVRSLLFEQCVGHGSLTKQESLLSWVPGTVVRRGGKLS